MRTRCQYTTFNYAHCQAPLKARATHSVFNPLRDLVNVNEWKIMFDPYDKIKTTNKQEMIEFNV